MPVEPARVCAEFFRELARQRIPFVLLHSYEHLPESFSSDVDFSVPTRDLPKLAGIQLALAEKFGWLLPYTIESRLFAFYSVLVDPADPERFLQLDACGHYVERGCLLFTDSALLANRQRRGELFIPAPEVEFGYLLAKALIKQKPLPAELPR